MPHDVRDQVVDFVRRWSEKTEIRVGRFIDNGLFFPGLQPEISGHPTVVLIHASVALAPVVKLAGSDPQPIGFHLENPLEGYRRLTFMMLDQDIVAVKSGECMAGVETSGTAVALEG